MKKLWVLIMVLALASLTFSCASLGTGNGSLQVYVTDALPTGVTAVEIKASNVEVHKSGAADDQWVTILKDPPVFDLVKASGVNVLLGTSDLTAGNYTQVRLDITDVTVTIAGKQVKATVPSDKLKLVGEIIIEEGKQTAISLDFDGEQSIVLEGQDRVSLKPVVKLIVAKPGATLGTPATTPATPATSTTPAAQATTAMAWGIVEIRATDPPPANVKSAVVYLSNIEVHRVSGNVSDNLTSSDNTSGWIPVLGAPASFDLMNLIGVEQILGSANITAGSFTQIRMDVTKVTGETTDNVSYTAEVPGDKLKIVGAFNVGGGNKTILTLDFDGEKSLIRTGEGKFLFKPVVKLLIENEKAKP